MARASEFDGLKRSASPIWSLLRAVHIRARSLRRLVCRTALRGSLGLALTTALQRQRFASPHPHGTSRRTRRRCRESSAGMSLAEQGRTSPCLWGILTVIRFHADFLGESAWSRNAFSKDGQLNLLAWRSSGAGSSSRLFSMSHLARAEVRAGIRCIGLERPHAIGPRERRGSDVQACGLPEPQSTTLWLSASPEAGGGSLSQGRAGAMFCLFSVVLPWLLRVARAGSWWC